MQLITKDLHGPAVHYKKKCQPTSILHCSNLTIITPTYQLYNHSDRLHITVTINPYYHLLQCRQCMPAMRCGLRGSCSVQYGPRRTFNWVARITCLCNAIIRAYHIFLMPFNLTKPSLGKEYNMHIYCRNISILYPSNENMAHGYSIKIFNCEFP